MKRVALCVLIACFTTGIGSGCHDDPPYRQGLFRISGTVTDSLTGSPIDSAKIVRFYNSPGREFFSDSTGFYEVTVTEGYAPTLIVSKSGYVTMERAFEALRQDHVGVDFELVPDSL